MLPCDSSPWSCEHRDNQNFTRLKIYSISHQSEIPLLSALLCKIAALRTFSLDKLHYWRERSSGMSSLAYFLAKDTIDHFNTIIKPLVYLSMFYFFNNPRSSVTDNYFVLVCLVYCVTGLAYVLAILFEPAPAQLVRIVNVDTVTFAANPLFFQLQVITFTLMQWSVLLPVVLTLIATHDDNSKVVDLIANMCYTKWALEAFVVSNAKRLEHEYQFPVSRITPAPKYSHCEWLWL